MNYKMRIDESYTSTPNHEANEIFSSELDIIVDKKQEAGTCCCSSATGGTAAGGDCPSPYLSRMASFSSMLDSCTSFSSMTDSCSDDSETSNDMMNEITHIHQSVTFGGDSFFELILGGKNSYGGNYFARTCVAAENHSSPPMVAGTSAPPPLESPLWAEAKHLLEVMVSREEDEDEDKEFSMNTRSTIPPSVYNGDQKQGFVDDPHHQLAAGTRRLLIRPTQDDALFDQEGHAHQTA
jgi:hypothetical protein